MKKYLFLAASVLGAFSIVNAQEITSADALRYATENLTGSARFRGMSGAFGALGGDISSININPAGSAVFNFNSGTASLSSFNGRNTADYFGSRAGKNDNSIELNQIGAVFIFSNTSEEASWKKIALAFNYENTNNFDNSIFTQGVNPNNSVSNYFINRANSGNNGNAMPIGLMENQNYGISDQYAYLGSSFPNSQYPYISGFDAQQAFLGYQAYLYDYDSAAGNYVSNVPQNSNFYQESAITTRGYNGKLTGNLATQYKDVLYLGLNLNGHFTNYLKTTSLYEGYDSSNSGLQALRFDNEVYTYGAGFSFGLGAIVKITPELRAGLAYESPTWYNLQDELRQSIASSCPGCDAGRPDATTFIIDPGITNVYNDYNIKTPSKYTGSLAYVFGGSGLISVDYSLKDYSKTKFTSSGYGDLNQQLSENLDMAGELRVGAEYRIKQFSFRGGYRYEQSPYKNGSQLGDLNGFSGGFGIAFPNSRLDLAYSYFQRIMQSSLISSGMMDMARIKNVNNNITLSYTIDL